jgi:hypothetical protein
MHRIDGAGHINNRFVHEDPANNRPPTEITADILNAFQEELATFIEWAGLILDKADNTQLKQALRARFAPLASPEFTETPTAPTPPQFDNSTRLATTESVKRQEVEYADVTLATALTVAHAGKIVIFDTAAAPVTVTLPATDVPVGAVFNLGSGQGIKPLTINTPAGGEFSIGAQSIGSSLVLKYNERVELAHM